MSKGSQSWRTKAAAPHTSCHKASTKTPFESIALLLQGGGALGAYQAGVYEKLLEADIEPNWIAGISIGAINSAIIVGNPRHQRVARLREFWEQVSNAGDYGWSHLWGSFLSDNTSRQWINSISAAQVMMRGVPGFFEPRFPRPYVLPGGGGGTSYYDTKELKATLERLVDFDRINSKEMRLSIGAVNVRTGNFTYFDNEKDIIKAQHIMASGALPPAFDAVEIEGEFYWDGGLVSNTPLDWVMSARTGLDTLVLQVDLWSARGMLPGNLSDVDNRVKEIRYSSRTRAATDTFIERHELRMAFNELLTKMPAELVATPEAQKLAQASNMALYNVVQLIYQAAAYEGESKDYEFSRRTMEEHWKAGYKNAEQTLSHPEVLTLPSNSQGVAIYDFLTKSR